MIKSHEYVIEIFEEENILQPWESLPSPPPCLTPEKVRAHIHSVLTETAIPITKEDNRYIFFEATEEQVQTIKEKLRQFPLSINKKTIANTC